MNERIRQLAEQAITEKLSIDEFIEALKKEPYDFYGFRVSELQKFAELIVRECIDVLDGKIYRASDHEGDETWPDLILNEHFEVEE